MGARLVRGLLFLMRPTHYYQHELDPFLLGPGKARVTLVVTLGGTDARQKL